jgi:hypothetical protein
MGILTDIYIASPSTAVAFDADRKPFREVTLSAKGITDLELSTLWAVYRGEEWDVKLLEDFEQLLFRDGGERLVIALPESLVSYLAESDEAKMETVGEQWGQTEEMERHADDVEEYLASLVELAKRARSNQMRLYLWVCV